MQNSRRLLIASLVSCLLTLIVGAQSGPLPRKSTQPKEQLPGLDVIYSEVSTGQGYRLRSIITRPTNSHGRLPAVLLAGWISCDSVEAPADTSDGFERVLHGVAQRSGFVLMRVDKAGVGDSEGPACRNTDFATELENYRAALRTLQRLDYVDPDRIFLLGMSTGGATAPLLGQGENIRGYIVSGGWAKTWYEHMIEEERRRLFLSGKTAGEVTRMMPLVSEFYDLYLNRGLMPGEILRRKPELRPVWNDEPDHQYGRPAAYYQQLQKSNVAAAWGKVNVPVLAIHGEYDWIMSREDFVLLTEIVNRNHSSLAQFIEIPRMDHFYLLHDSAEAAFRNKPKGMLDDAAVVDVMVQWLKAHQ